MITVLAYWLLLFFTFLPIGIFTSKILKLKIDNTLLSILIGMFSCTITFTCVSFFTGLGLGAVIVSLIVSSLVGIVLRKEIVQQLRNLKSQIWGLTVIEKTAIVCLIIAAALKSAQVPKIIDNETYYIQTIKWVNEYGFVKGLGNLHLFLGQMSPWHVLQSGFSFSGIMGRLNDLNGFVFVVCTVYYFTGKQVNSWLKFIPLLSVLFFFFLDAPSPDLPLLVVLPIIFHLLLENNKDDLRPAWLLFLFIAFIKITIAPVGLVFLYPILKDRKQLLFMLISGMSIAALWIAKNIIITGYPLYPLTILPTGADWQVPEHLLRGTHLSSNKYIYGTTDGLIINKIISWFLMPGIDGIFNKLIVVLFAVMPFFRKVREEKMYTAIYLALLVQFIILLFTSPQFRFFLPTVVFFGAFIGHELFVILKLRAKVYEVALHASLLVVMLVTINKTEWEQLYLPTENSAYRTEFVERTRGNLKYYTPKSNPSFYGAGKGPLPCVNTAQLRYFEVKYKLLPQMRGKTLREGFYSRQVDTE